MTSPADWRAQRYAAKSAAWLAGYRAFSVMGQPAPDASEEYLNGWERRDIRAFSEIAP